MKDIDSVTLNIIEIFHSLQGEGIDMGLPTVFIRLAGCNLRCAYCDTTYAYERGVEQSISDIMKRVCEWECKRVCITGGEPLLQTGVYMLINELLAKKYEISVETNGSMDIATLREYNVRIKMDIKLPSSGTHDAMSMRNISLLRPCDEVKFVIGDREDYEYAKHIMKCTSIPCPVIMQPVWGMVPELAEWILDDELEVRFSPQLHKMLWGEKRGV